MKFPLKICKLTLEEQEIFKNHYAKNNKFVFEGLWYRTQDEINKERSLWQDQNSNRRRTIHVRNTYKLQDGTLCLSASYIYLSVRLELQAYDTYLTKIKEALKEAKYILKRNIYSKEDLKIKLIEYISHPKEKYIKGYRTVDIFIYSTNTNNLNKYYEQVWNLYTKGIRRHDVRENPTYIESINELKAYLPAQIELGCGPSIESGINPLYHLHEIYKVQNHTNKLFYFADSDDFVPNLILNDYKKYLEFSEIIKNCLKAKPTLFHKTIKKMYDKGLFVGPLLNNNFDHLSSIMNIKEQNLRVYQIAKYFPQITFAKKAKSLICIGTHADRRLVEKQARNKGLKVIYIDPEGFKTDTGFLEYLIEGPKTNDLIWRIDSNTFAKELKKEFHL